MMYRNEDFIYDSETRQDGKAYGQHRVAWLLVHGYWPYEIDHVNGIKMDNRLCNLRAVSSSENSRNKPRQSNNLSGITGVRFCTKRKRWVSQIKFQGRVEFLGRYRDLFNAVCARKSAEVKYGFHENHGRTKA